jgi:hypothetical protein
MAALYIILIIASEKQNGGMNILKTQIKNTAISFVDSMNFKIKQTIDKTNPPMKLIKKTNVYEFELFLK